MCDCVTEFYVNQKHLVMPMKFINMKTLARYSGFTISMYENDDQLLIVLELDLGIRFDLF